MVHVFRPKVIACDLDFTLSHFTTGIESLLDVLTKQGVSQSAAQAAWQNAENEGFTIKRLHHWAEQLVESQLPLDEIEKDFALWLELSLALYDDVLAAISRWQEDNIPMTIVTFGNPEYQMQKVATMKLHEHGAVYVEQVHKKWSVVADLAKRGTPVLFLEDKVSELDAVFENGLSREQVTTVRVLREDSPHFGKPGKYFHIEIQSLADLVFI